MRRAADADASPERPAVAAADDRAVGPADAGAQRAADPETDADPDAPAVAGTHAEAIIPADAQADALALAAPDPETDAGPDARARRSDGRAGLRADASPDAQPDAQADASAHVLEVQLHDGSVSAVQPHDGQRLPADDGLLQGG